MKAKEKATGKGYKMYCSECGDVVYYFDSVELGTEILNDEVWVVSADWYDCHNCGNVFSREYLDYCLGDCSDYPGI